MDWWNSFTAWIDWDVVTAVATVAAALVAVFALISAARDSLERSRPDVVAEYRVSERVSKSLTFVIRNAGPTAARDVRVSFDPTLDGALPGQKLRPFVRDRYAEIIPTLGPGQELTNVVYYDAEDAGETDLPDDLTVTVSFKGYRRRRYESRYRLRASVFRHHTYATSSDSLEGRLKEIVRSSKSTASATASIAKVLNRISGQNRIDAKRHRRQRELLDQLGNGRRQKKGRRSRWSRLRWPRRSRQR